MKLEETYLDNTHMKEIPKFPNYYITTEGRVISMQNPNNPKEVKPYIHKNGHVEVGLYYTPENPNAPRRKKLSVAKLVAEAFIENPDNAPHTIHKDGNPKNNDVSNLYWSWKMEGH